MFTYKDLLEQLQQLSESELNRDVSIFLKEYKGGSIVLAQKFDIKNNYTYNPVITVEYNII